VGYVIFLIPVMHRRFLRSDMWRWYIADVGLSAACCVIIGAMLKIHFADNVTTLMRLTALTITGGSMFLVCALVLPASRSYFRKIY